MNSGTTERRSRKCSRHIPAAYPSLYSLYDIAILGITNHSKVPLPVLAMAGFAISMLSLRVALGYLVVVAKLVFRNDIQLGMAPLLVEKEPINVE